MSYTDQVKQDARKAADHIRVHGWCQGEYKAPDGRVCALGAIRLSTGRMDDCELARVFAKEIGGVSYVHEWNDATGRKKKEVLAVFDRIANS